MHKNEDIGWDEHEEDDDCGLCELLGIQDVLLIGELRVRGFDPIPPDDVKDEDLPTAIMALAEELAKLRVFIDSTDHLSDRRLYRRLYDETLQEWCWISPDDPLGATHVDLVGSGADEDHLAWLTYYADDDARKDALTWDPELKLPEKKTPPFNRDAMFPKVTYELPDPEREDDA